LGLAFSWKQCYNAERGVFIIILVSLRYFDLLFGTQAVFCVFFDVFPGLDVPGK